MKAKTNTSKLRIKRAERQITQYELGKALGFPQYKISMVERGRSSFTEEEWAKVWRFLDG